MVVRSSCRIINDLDVAVVRRAVVSGDGFNLLKEIGTAWGVQAKEHRMLQLFVDRVYVDKGCWCFASLIMAALHIRFLSLAICKHSMAQRSQRSN
jgi:hypothetical protein